MRQGAGENPVLMESSVTELRNKLRSAKGTLKKYRDHFLALARGDAGWFGLYQPLAYLITGDEVFRKQARAAFLRYAELVPEGDVSLEAQVHTHVIAAPLGHWACLFDWACELKILRPAEQKAVAAALLNQAQKFPMQQLQGRTKGFDNQVFSNAFSCAAVGYVLGQKRGHDPLAQRMLGLGLAWLRLLIADISRDGYSLEGSTYHEQVTMPVTLWGTLLYQQVTKTKLIDVRHGNNNVSVLDMLQYSCNMVSPGGLEPGWDAYGHQKASVRSFLAYLAKFKQDAEPLRVIRDTCMWDRMAHPAWECHDRMWTLTWWPEGLEWEKGAPAYRPWMGKSSAGALNDGASRSRLFQYWDECGGLAYSGRCEVSANAISFEAFGSPLILDGTPGDTSKLTPIPGAKALEYVGRDKAANLAKSWGMRDGNYLEDAARRCMAGNIGLSNTIHFDHEDWYVPVDQAFGQGVAVHDLGSFQALTSEAKDYYKDRYDVESVQRTSAMLAGRWCIVHDRAAFKSEHDVTWQAFIPAGSAQAGEAVCGSVPTGVGLSILSDTKLKTELTPAPEFPKSLDIYSNGSTRLRLHGRTAAKSWDHAVCLTAHEDLAVAEGMEKDFSLGWSADFGTGKKVKIDLRDAIIADPSSNMSKPRRFSRSFKISKPGGEWYLRLEKGVARISCKVNGKDAPKRYEAKSERWDGFTTMPHVFVLTGLLQAGMNEVELEAISFHGDTLAGPVQLLQPSLCKPDVEFRKLDACAYEVSIEGEKDLALLDNKAGMVDMGSFKTDALHAVKSAAGFMAFSDATAYEAEGVSFESRAPASLSFQPGEGKAAPLVIIDNLRDNNQFTLKVGKGRLVVESTGWLFVRWSGKGSIRLRVSSSEPRQAVINGKDEGWLKAGEAREFAIDPACGKASAKDLSSAYTALEVLAAPEKDLMQALNAKDWTTVLSALDALPFCGNDGAGIDGAALAKLLEKESAMRPDPELSCWWRQAKMLHWPGPDTPDKNVPMPQGAKRWRLRRALVSALGKLRYKPAIPLLIKLADEGNEYFAVTSQYALALARLDAKEALPVLESQWDHGEINTRRLVRLAVQYLRGEITRSRLEAEAPPG